TEKGRRSRRSRRSCTCGCGGRISRQVNALKLHQNVPAGDFLADFFPEKHLLAAGWKTLPTPSFLEPGLQVWIQGIHGVSIRNSPCLSRSATFLSWPSSPPANRFAAIGRLIDTLAPHGSESIRPS